MQDAYKKACPYDSGHYMVLGVHNSYKRLVKKTGESQQWKLHPETGTVYLCMEHAGSSIVCHEIMHAIFWSHKHARNKKQYPIIIKDMKEEEKILHNLTFAVRQFYDWYWKIEKTLK